MRLLCAISHHGLGHLAQTAPVLNALHAARPGLEWLIWSGLTREALARRLALPFSHRHEPADVGLVMQDAVRVDELASLQAYQSFHQGWGLRVDRAADWLRQQHVDGVLSNAAYLPLAAAAQAGINAVGFSSLNWWDIAHHYLQASPDMAPAFVQMRAAYQSARAFLRLTPGLPMSWLANLEPAPALASIGRNRREELNGELALAAEQKLVLLGFGGIAYQPPNPLPRLEGVVWLVSDAWPTPERSDVIHFERTRMPFSDLLASSDALVTKVGYGSFVEAAGLGLPVLYLDRPDWPETPWLAPWLSQHTRAMSIDEGMLFSPLVGEALANLWQCPAPKLPDISGAQTIGRRIMALLGA